MYFESLVVSLNMFKNYLMEKVQRPKIRNNGQFEEKRIRELVLNKVHTYEKEDEKVKDNNAYRVSPQRRMLRSVGRGGRGRFHRCRAEDGYQRWRHVRNPAHSTASWCYLHHPHRVRGHLHEGGSVRRRHRLIPREEVGKRGWRNHLWMLVVLVRDGGRRKLRKIRRGCAKWLLM